MVCGILKRLPSFTTSREINLVTWLGEWYQNALRKAKMDTERVFQMWKTGKRKNTEKESKMKEKITEL